MNEIVLAARLPTCSKFLERADWRGWPAATATHHSLQCGPPAARSANLPIGVTLT